MKTKLVLLLTLLIFSNTVFAGSFNPALYQSMRVNSYRNNYYRNVTNRVVPYWQAQANYSTRNRLYQNYSNYNNYTHQYNSSVNSARGYR